MWNVNSCFDSITHFKINPDFLEICVIKLRTIIILGRL